MGSKSSKHGKKPSTVQTRKQQSTAQRAAPETDQLSTSQRTEPVTDQLSTSQRDEPITDQLPTSRTASPDTDDGESFHTKKLLSRFIL